MSSVIGDYVTVAPRVNCNGNIHIYDHTYIRLGAVIKQGASDKPLMIIEKLLLEWVLWSLTMGHLD